MIIIKNSITTGNHIQQPSLRKKLFSFLSSVHVGWKTMMATSHDADDDDDRNADDGMDGQKLS